MKIKFLLYPIVNDGYCSQKISKKPIDFKGVDYTFDKIDKYT